jgi:hypothetical protein
MSSFIYAALIFIFMEDTGSVMDEILLLEALLEQQYGPPEPHEYAPDTWSNPSDLVLFCTRLNIIEAKYRAVGLPFVLKLGGKTDMRLTEDQQRGFEQAYENRGWGMVRYNEHPDGDYAEFIPKQQSRDF